MIKKYKVLGALVAIFLLANIASAGVGLTVSPVGSETTVPGGTIKYIVAVTAPEGGLNYWEEEHMSVVLEDPLLNNWNFGFNPNIITLLETETYKSSILTVDVPENAEPGDYTYTVKATAYSSDPFTGETAETGANIYVVDTPIAPVPELNTGILTSIGMFGIILISKRNRKR